MNRSPHCGSSVLRFSAGTNDSRFLMEEVSSLLRSPLQTLGMLGMILNVKSQKWIFSNSGRKEAVTVWGDALQTSHHPLHPQHRRLVHALSARRLATVCKTAGRLSAGTLRSATARTTKRREAQ